MNIEHGLLSGQVLQRNSRNVGSAELDGTADGDGKVEARILKGARPVKGWNWRPVGKAAAGRFHANLASIPAGGPYVVDLRVVAGTKRTDKTTLREIFVGDVWFMAGQSNMQGCGDMGLAPKPHPMVRCFFMRDEWGVAREPLHQLSEAVDFFHNSGVRASQEQAAKERKHMARGVCSGMFFGAEMFKRTGVPQGLVACAHGGTSMAQWSPDLKDQGGKSLYGAMFRRFKKLGQPVRGILWYQGESDANPEAAAVYTRKMNELVAATRADFALPALPWIIVQLGRFVADGAPSADWNSIQEQQRRLAENTKNLEVVPAIDLELEDGIHIGSRGHEILGVRIARMADRVALGNRSEAGSIRFGSISVARPKSGSGDPRAPWYEITFKNVVGGLRSKGLPEGFTFFDATGRAIDIVYKTLLAGDKVILELTRAPNAALTFSHGHGLNPYCNITDGRGMAVPVFGPMRTGGRFGSAFLVGWQISGPYEDREVKTAGLPGEELAWRPPHSVGPSLIMPQDVNAAKPGMFYLRSAINVAAAGKYLLAMGADSPYRIWINGRQVAVNLTATNPCSEDEYPQMVELPAGRSEIAVSFDGRKGGGWGICMRFYSSVKDEDLPPNTIVE